LAKKANFNSELAFLSKYFVFCSIKDHNRNKNSLFTVQTDTSKRYIKKFKMEKESLSWKTVF